MDGLLRGDPRFGFVFELHRREIVQGCCQTNVTAQIEAGKYVGGNTVIAHGVGEKGLRGVIAHGVGFWAGQAMAKLPSIRSRIASKAGFPFSRAVPVTDRYPAWT